MVARLTSRSLVMDVRRRFSVRFSLEKERSALQLAAIETKYILRALATLHILASNDFVLPIAQSWCLLSPRLWIYRHNLQSDTQFNKWIVETILVWINECLLGCCGSTSEVKLDRQPKQPNRLDVIFNACRRWSREAKNLSMVGWKLSLYLNEGLRCASSAWPQFCGSTRTLWRFRRVDSLYILEWTS